MFDETGLSECLADWSPEPELGTVLATVDRDRLSGHDRVLLLQARARQVAHYQAELYADIHSVWVAEREVANHELSDLADEGLVLSKRGRRDGELR